MFTHTVQIWGDVNVCMGGGGAFEKKGQEIVHVFIH